MACKLSMACNMKWNGDYIMGQIKSELTRRLKKFIQEAKNQVVKNIGRSGRGLASSGRSARSQPGEFPTADRGFLRRSIFHQMTGELSGIIGVDAQSPAAKYARRLEEGGVITSHGKLMAIPISPAAKKHSETGGPRTFPKPLVKIRRKSGRPPILVEIPPSTKTGKQGKKPWILHYVLSPRVTIAARPYLVRTVTEMVPRLQQIMSEPMRF